jgi:hypothetical protein
MFSDQVLSQVETCVAKPCSQSMSCLRALNK